MRALFFCLALGLSAAAAAQTITSPLSLNFNGQTSITVGPTSCGNSVSVTWTATPVGQACSDIQLWVTSNGACSDAPATGDQQISSNGLLLTNWISTRTGSVAIPVSALPIFSVASSDGGTLTCGAAIQKDLLVCAAYKYGTVGLGCTSSTVAKAGTTTLRYDAQPPGAPSLNAPTPLDGALLLSVASTDSDTAIIHFGVRAAGETDFASGGDMGTDQSTLRLSGLTNGVAYEVQATAEDKAGNVGPASAVVTGTPVHTTGFFDRYKGSGGEEAGCAATGVSGPLLGAALLTGFFFARRRRG